MSAFICKMCGAPLNLTKGSYVSKCEYCGTTQTVPLIDSDKKATLFSRAHRLCLSGEFDKAAGIYESVITECPEEAEAYWGLVLCKYGIEYVDDPMTAKKVPTCHRLSHESVMTDLNYEKVMELSCDETRQIYKDEAVRIEEIRQKIFEISAKESPYDIFICYKETDVNGARTVDSVIAEEIYSALTESGYRVFFSRVSLEDKLGSAYEPYIFAALNSSKIMLAVGTSFENYNAVWVKNEWSRFLHFINEGKKKFLIPCYKDIDAYDMPQEFSHLQAQDMGKIGAIQDLLRGIKKIMGGAPADAISAKAVSATVEPLLRRGFGFLSEGEFKKADDLFEQVLNFDLENARAYLGKLMVEYKVTLEEALGTVNSPLEQSGFYKKIIDYGDKELIERVTKYNESTLKNSALIDKKREKRNRIIMLSILALFIVAIIMWAWFGYFKPRNMCSKADDLFENREYKEALEIYQSLNDYPFEEWNCNRQIRDCWNGLVREADSLVHQNKYSEAIEQYRALEELYNKCKDSLSYEQEYVFDDKIEYCLNMLSGGAPGSVSFNSSTLDSNEVETEIE